LRNCLKCFLDYYREIFSRPGDFKNSDFFKKHKENFSFCRVAVSESCWGNIRKEEAVFLSALVCLSAPKIIFEFGTFNGFSTAHLAMNAPEGGRVYTIDLPDGAALPEKNLSAHQAYDDLLTVEFKGRNAGRFFAGGKAPGNIVQLRGDTLDYDFSAWHGKVDFCFIDACHSYKYVKSDSENAFRMLSRGGIIVWHDFDINHYDVFRYLNRLAGKNKLYIVPGTTLAVYFNAEKGSA